MVEREDIGNPQGVESTLNASDVGRHLLLGSLVIPKADSDPTGETRGHPDGLAQFWVENGAAKLGIYSADLGRWVLVGDEPIGTIKGYVGAVADIPDGWFICDGRNGTHDLTGYFIVGSLLEDATEVTGTQGTLVDSHAQGLSGTPSDTVIIQSGTGQTVASFTHEHTTPALSHTVASFKLAFIQRVS